MLDDENIARSVAGLAHPLRLTLLRTLLERGESSPRDLAPLVSESIPLVAYHVRELAEAGLLINSRTVPVRGALKHYYVASDRGERLLFAIDGALG